MRENARSDIQEVVTAVEVEAGGTTETGAEIEVQGDEMTTGHPDAIETCLTTEEAVVEVEEEDPVTIALDEMTATSSPNKQELLVEEGPRVRLRKSENQLQI